MSKVAIIGTGLIGTSLAMALKQSELRGIELVGADYDRTARSGAEKKGAFLRIESRMRPVVQDADMVILATPIMAMRDLMETMAGDLKEGCLVTDVGSSKKVVMEWAEQYLPKSVDFVGGHPMAGKETAGPSAADANLFRGKAYCVVAGPGAQQQAVSEVTTLAEAIGARPFFIGVDEHDSFVAAASHLPFLVSVALMGCTSKSINWEDIAQLASTGYQDITRLASGDAVMHRDICLTNGEPIVAWIDAFIRELYEMRKLLVGEEAAKDATHEEEIRDMFQQASDARARLLSGAIRPMTGPDSDRAAIPSFSDQMSEVFLGSKVMEMQRRLFKDPKSKGPKVK